MNGNCPWLCQITGWVQRVSWTVTHQPLCFLVLPCLPPMMTSRSSIRNWSNSGFIFLRFTKPSEVLSLEYMDRLDRWIYVRVRGEFWYSKNWRFDTDHDQVFPTPCCLESCAHHPCISLYLHIPAKGTRVDLRWDAANHASRAIGVTRFAITTDARGEAWQHNIDDLLDVP